MWRATVCFAITLLAGPAFAQADVSGKILWGAEVPAPKVINVAAAPMCAAKGPVLDETYVVNPKNKGLKWTFVWLAPQKKGDKMPIAPALKNIPPDKKNVEIDQPVCSFIPHAIALREGQHLVVKNSAPFPHNFKWGGNPTNSAGNPLIPAGGQVVIEDIKADRIPWIFECNIHPWMRGTMMCFDHPYFAVTGDDGDYEIKNIPPGTYQLMVRHSTGVWLGGAKGKDGKTITIKAGDNKQPDLEFTP